MELLDMDYLNTAEITRFTLLFLALQIMLVSYWMTMQALFAAFVARADEEYGRPWKAGLIGLAMLLVVLALMGAMSQLQHGLQFVAAVLGVVILCLALAGAAGLARRIGRGLGAPVDDSQGWRATWKGSLVMGGLMLVPLVGLVPLTLFLVTGLGSTWLSLRKREVTAVPSPPRLPEPME